MGRTALFRFLVRGLQIARRRHLAARGEPPPTPSGWGPGKLRWTRRGFLQLGAATGSAAVLEACRPGWARERPGRRQPRIAVVGGGLAGLNAAYQLKKLGYRAEVFEARRRLGGRVLSVRDALGPGLVTELGGEFINSDHRDMLSLAQEFGLPLFDRRSLMSALPKTAYYFAGRRMDEAEVATNLDDLAAQIIADAALLDRDWETHAPRFDALSASDYLDLHASKIPVPWVRRLLAVAIASEYGAELGDSSALQLLFLLPQFDGTKVEILGYSDEVFNVQGGNSEIIGGLGRALDGQIRLGKTLRRLVAKPGGFRLVFAKGDDEREGGAPGRQRHHGDRDDEVDDVVEADYVILAVPFTTLRDVDLRVDLPPGLGRFIREMSLGTNAKILAGYSRRPWSEPGGFVEELWWDDFQLAWDATIGQAGIEGAITFFAGGNLGLELGRGAAREQGERLVQAFENVIPGSSALHNGRFLRKHWPSDPRVKGSYTNFRPGQLTSFAQDWMWIESENPDEARSVHVGKRLVFCGEHVSDEFYGFMNGAAQTGRLAAQLVAQAISAGAGRRQRSGRGAASSPVP